MGKLTVYFPSSSSPSPSTILHIEYQIYYETVIVIAARTIDVSRTVIRLEWNKSAVYVCGCGCVDQ